MSLQGQSGQSLGPGFATIKRWTLECSKFNAYLSSDFPGGSAAKIARFEFMEPRFDPWWRTGKPGMLQSMES